MPAQKWKAACPVCNASLTTTTEARGQVVDCPKCGHSVPVPVVQPTSATMANTLAALFGIIIPILAALRDVRVGAALAGLAVAFAVIRAAILIPARLANLERIHASPF